MTANTDETYNTPRPAKTRVDAANAARARTAATKAMDNLVRRLRWLDDATLAKLVEAGRFEQLIRAQARDDRMET